MKKKTNPKTIESECKELERLSAQGNRDFRAVRSQALKIADMAKAYCDDKDIQKKMTTIEDLSKKTQQIRTLVSEIRKLVTE